MNGVQFEVDETGAVMVADDFARLAEAILDGHTATAEDGLAILGSRDDELMAVVGAAARLRWVYFANTVKVNYLVNIRSGMCPENCGYCSQALGSRAPILKYSWLTAEQTLEQAHAGLAAGASRVCLVASGRGPSTRDIDKVTEMTVALKARYPDVEVCACLGLLQDGQAERLKTAGVHAYNHNINTAESNHANVVSTHTYQDRVDTVSRAKTASLSPCSGLIAGLGETDEQLVEALLALRELGSDSIPVNFLMPFDGTPLQKTWNLTPTRCVRILAAARMLCPDTEIRIAGGREMHLRSLQPIALQIANSIFLGDYLTSEGQGAHADLAMIQDNGLVVLGADADQHQPQRAEQAEPRIRHRGAGTTVRPNA